MSNYRINAPVQLDYAKGMKMDYGDIIVEKGDQIPDAAKVVYFGETLVDLTNDTATPEHVENGYTFHGADGVTYTGTGGIFPINPSPTPSTPGAIWIETS